MSTLVSTYTERFNVVLKQLDGRLRDFLDEVFATSDFVCRISTRPKKITSFLKKAGQLDGVGQPKYVDPLTEIQDQLGALVITRFLSDIEQVEQVVDRTFRRIERQHITPESEYEFGYEGRHFILFLPTDITTHFEADEIPEFFELQVKTLFQYAWSETNHAMGYKQNSKLTFEQKRLTAFVAAQAWGADRAVDQLKRDFEGMEDEGHASVD